MPRFYYGNSCCSVAWCEKVYISFLPSSLSPSLGKEPYPPVELMQCFNVTSNYSTNEQYIFFPLQPHTLVELMQCFNVTPNYWTNEQILYPSFHVVNALCLISHHDIVCFALLISSRKLWLRITMLQLRARVKKNMPWRYE